MASRSFHVTEEIRNVPVYFYSSAQSFSGQSSSSGDLLPEMMESETPPPTSSPNKADDSEVSSRRVILDQQAVQGTKELLNCLAKAGVRNEDVAMQDAQDDEEDVDAEADLGEDDDEE